MTFADGFADATGTWGGTGNEGGGGGKLVDPTDGPIPGPMPPLSILEEIYNDEFNEFEN